MGDLSRRDAVKLATALAIGGGTLVRQAEAGDEKPAAGGVQGLMPLPAMDADLEQARRGLESFMFSEQVTFKLEGDGASRDLVITSAKGEGEKPARVFVRSAVMRIFRADASVDAFTREGGVYWQFHDKAGTFKFKQPGALVLIVRDHDDTVRCYSLVYDERC
jgi:hypothetical protein